MASLCGFALARAQQGDFPVGTRDATATVTVYPAQDRGPVNPLLFGNNQLAYQDGRDDYSDRGGGIWDPQAGRPVPEYVRLAKLSGMTVSRWPGGCGAHTYNWKKAVGSLADRPDQAFGLPEFLQWCQATDSIPLITLADFWGEPEDAADLVEYLNSPNDGSNPNGGKDWAALRAADGHPPPYNVVWFECGNETYHGEHSRTDADTPRKRLAAQDYATRYLAFRSAMKAVDPDIKLGAVLQHGLQSWNRIVLDLAGSVMDFGIDHTYLPTFHQETTPDQSRKLLQAAAGCGAQLQEIYDGLNRLVEEVTGRTDLPWVISEYNGHFVQSQPVPYRQTLANALRNAEHLRVMMNPENRIAMANFWQFANEYWGMVRGYVHRNEPIVPQANFYVYQLYSQHFGERLIGARVQCDTWEFGGAGGVRPRTGKPAQETLAQENLLSPDTSWDITRVAGLKQVSKGPLLAVVFPGRDINYYHASITVPAKPDTWYRVKSLVKTDGLSGSRGACLQVGDARGWEITKSCAISDEVVATSDWREIEVEYKTLPSTEAICIMARRLGDDKGDNAVSGTAYFRPYRIEAFTPANLGAVPDITVNASRSDNGRIHVIMVNTNLDRDNVVNVEIAGIVPKPLSKARAWLLAGPAPWATNLGRTQKIKLSLPRVPAGSRGWRVPLPAHSMIAVEITP